MPLEATSTKDNGPRSGTDAIQRSFARHMKYSLAKDRYSATSWDRYVALSLTIRDLLIERWIETQQHYHRSNCKRVYYLSLEYLLGRSLAANIINLGVENECELALRKLDLNWQAICELGVDAGLGNGGLGRLAACFLDSMATLALPATGYGLRYDFGIFRQTIRDGYQVEEPDEWLRFGHPWEIERPEYTFPVYFGGHVETRPHNGSTRYEWCPSYNVTGVPFDIPIAGYGNDTVNTLRLWSAKASEEFDLADFNQGDYIEAVKHKILAENLTKVLYPNDNNYSGKELRFSQEYFFVACSIQDIVRRFRTDNQNFERFPDKVAIQLNDTHPAIAIAELMHVFVDKHHLSWETAWELTEKTFGYTNHTLLPEALEKWPVDLFERLLPRHLQIVYEINRRFLDRVALDYPGDTDRLRRMSLVDESHPRQIRMAHLATVGSHSINGVAALHTLLIQRNLFRDFYALWPEKFNNKTNGITPRRWLRNANPMLAQWITERIGEAWIKDLMQLKKLEKYTADAASIDSFRTIKLKNKETLGRLIQQQTGITVDPSAIFDVQVKRFHEYKRQLLNILHVITLYHRLKDNPRLDMVPRVFIFSGKAAPGYGMAKSIIKLITSVSDVLHRDPKTSHMLQVVFLPNYEVSLAEKIIPAADVSEQISTAGMEASGTGNMKLALNGALTIGTLDGANIEIRDEVGEDNIFIFGKKAEEIESLRASGNYDPRTYYNDDGEIRATLDLIRSNFFSMHNPDIFQPILKSLLDHGDFYCVLADFRSYSDAHARIDKLYRDRAAWNKSAMVNVARMGRFSSDRVIQQYADEIWHAKPERIDLAMKGSVTITEARANLSR